MKLNLVPARTGVAWAQQGVRTFIRQPLLFFSLFMLFMTVAAFVSLLPVIGGALGLMVIPAMTLALMVATEQVSAAQLAHIRVATPLAFVAALAAVRQRARPLALLGLMFALGVFAAMWLASLFDNDPLQRAFQPDGKPDLEVMQSASFQMAIWLRLAFYAPISLLFWHAPALAHWHDVPPVKSLFFSWVACFRNVGAMTLFGLTWLGVSLVASMLLGLAATLLRVAGGGFGAAAIVGGSLALTAMFFCTNWFIFRDSFRPS
ncbi:MAG: hypothetical protein JWQ03_567 [Variovorax sp.]|nr:hypothetical protein [Variovorax sp.]